MIRALMTHEWRLRWRDLTGVLELVGLCAALVVVWTLLADRQMTLPVPPVVAMWITVLFATVLYTGRSFDAEWHADGSRVLESWQQLPQVLPIIFWSKWLATVVVLCGVAVLVWGALALVPIAEITGGSWGSWAAVGAGIVGLSALGTLFGGVLCADARRGAVLPLICYPLAIPLLLVVSQCLLADLSAAPVMWTWLQLAWGVALAYLLLASWLFGVLLGREEST